MGEKGRRQREALEEGLTDAQRSELTAFIYAVGSEHPAVRRDGLSLSAAVQETANAWAHSEDKDRTRCGVLALTACKDYPEGVLDLCKWYAKRWRGKAEDESEDHPPIPYTLYLDGPRGVE